VWHQLYTSVDRLRSLDVGQNADGRLEVIGVAPDDTIWHTWQEEPNGGWVGGWAQLYTPVDRLRELRVARNQDGRLEVIGVAPDDTIWHTWQVPPNDDWVGGWAQLYTPADRLRSLDVGQNADGRLEVIGVAPDDTIWFTWQVPPNDDWVGGWAQLYTPENRLRELRVARNRNGRLEVIGVAPDNTIWHTWQEERNDDWVGGWEQLYTSGGELRSLEIGQNADGRLEVIGVAPDDTIWHTWQVEPNDGWVGGWEQLYTPEDRLRELRVARNRDGRLEVIGVGPDNTIWHTWQEERNEGWVGSWEQLYPTRCIRVLIKTIVNPNVPINTMLANMQTVFASAGIRVDEGPREALTIRPNPGAPPQTVFNVGDCILGQDPTADQTLLFQNRNDAGPNDIVLYLILAATPNGLNGCVTFPGGPPGAVVVQAASQWTMAHEVGHVLGLKHITGESTNCPPTGPARCCNTPNFARLITGCGTDNITGTPGMSQDEIDDMQGSNLIQRCFDPSQVLRTLEIGQNENGRLEVFGVAPDDTIWFTWQTAPGSWPPH
jgi:hypothetical protein